MNARKSLVLVALALAGVAGCGPTPSGGVLAAPDRSGHASNLLTLADMQARLRTAGFNPQVGEQVEQSFLGVPGTLLRLPEAELQVYTYSDRVARAGDTASLDTARVVPPTMRITWIMPASLVTVENVAVIVLTRDEVLRTRIRNALTTH